MRSIDELGIFWIEGHEQDELTGRLTFDPEGNGPDLEIVGWFDNLDRNSRAAVNLQGWIANEEVTIRRCYVSGSFRAPGPETSRFHGNELFVGAHLDGELEFDAASVTFEDIEEWVGRTGVAVDNADDRYEIVCESLPLESGEFSDGNISLRIAWETPGVRFSGVSVKQWPVFKLEYSERRSFEEIRQDVGRLESLISLCVDSPVFDVGITLWRSDARVVMLDGTESARLKAIDHLASRVNYRPAGKREPRQRYRMLLTYEELGGIDLVAKWMDASTVFARPLSSLMSIQRARQMFMENKFMNVTFAAEALHRAIIGGGQRMAEEEFEKLLSRYLDVTPEEHRSWLIGKTNYMNEASLPKRLNKLAARAGKSTKELLGDRGKWAQTIASVRNDITHLKEGASSARGSDLYYMAESVYAVVRACMLLECGVDPDVLDRKSNEHHMVWYKHQLLESIARVRSSYREDSDR